MQKAIKAMQKLSILVCLMCFIVGCQPTKRVAQNAPSDNVLLSILQSRKEEFKEILENPALHEVQIIYTQINRDAQNVPHLTSYYYNVDSTHYFYPASTVKLPLSLLALEKINQLKKQHPNIDKDNFYRLDSLRKQQIPYATDAEAPYNKPSIAHDIRKILLVSDNYAYNHLFDFLGRDYINQALWKKGLRHTRIMHRFSIPGIENRYTMPITMYDKNDAITYQQGELDDNQPYLNYQKDLFKGKGYYDGNDSLVMQPFDFTGKNYCSLNDLESIVKAIIFPEITPVSQRFDLTAADYQFVYKYMSIFPREADYPKYDTTEYYDGYCKFLMYGDGKEARPKHIRIFNKVGDAYGYLTDVAYIVDFETGVEFFLSATLSANDDGIYNDNTYNYEGFGYPFMGRLGRAVYDYERQRARKFRPDLGKFK